MIIYLLRRISLLLSTLFMISLLAFSLPFLFPGSPLENITGLNNLAPDAIHQLTLDLRLNEGYPSQYLHYLGRLLTGEWGVTFSDQSPVFEGINAIFPATLELILYSLVLSLLLGVPLGIVAAVRYHKVSDYLILGGSLVGYSIPVYWLSLILILIFSLQLGWLPMSGRISLIYDVPHVTGFIMLDTWLSDIPDKWQAIRDAGRHIVLPTLSITTISMAYVIKLTRSAMVDVLQQNYIQAAKAKGLPFIRIMWRHGLRNTMLPIIPQLSMLFSVIFTSAMIAEVIFSWPGVGKWLIQAIYQRDFPAIQGGLVAVATLIVCVNILIDLINITVNPVLRNEIYGQN